MKYLLSLLVLAGCAASPPEQPLTREKAGASQQEFMSERYDCLQRSTVVVSRSMANAYAAGGATQSGCDYQLYDACMNSKGFVLVYGGRFQAPVSCVQ